MKGNLKEHTLLMPPQFTEVTQKIICYHWFRNICVFHNFCVVTHVTPLLFTLHCYSRYNFCTSVIIIQLHVHNSFTIFHIR